MQEENITKVVFAETLKRLIKEKGTTQNALAAYVGKTQANVSKWCKGSIPAGDLSLKIALFFNVPVETLFTGKRPSGKRYIDRLAEEKREADLSRVSAKLKEMSKELKEVSREVEKIEKTRTIET